MNESWELGPERVAGSNLAGKRKSLKILKERDMTRTALEED